MMIEAEQSNQFSNPFLETWEAVKGGLKNKQVSQQQYI
jgi:hypothetical protein